MLSVNSKFEWEILEQPCPCVGLRMYVEIAERVIRRGALTVITNARLLCAIDCIHQIKHTSHPPRSQNPNKSLQQTINITIEKFCQNITSEYENYFTLLQKYSCGVFLLLFLPPPRGPILLFLFIISIY